MQYRYVYVTLVLVLVLVLVLYSLLHSAAGPKHSSVCIQVRERTSDQSNDKAAPRLHVALSASESAIALAAAT